MPLAPVLVVTSMLEKPSLVTTVCGAPCWKEPAPLAALKVPVEASTLKVPAPGANPGRMPIARFPASEVVPETVNLSNLPSPESWNALEAVEPPRSIASEPVAA